MSCIITYNGNKYTQEQFKEYISSNKNEFSHIIASNKNVIDSFKRKMEGIDYVFSQSPELASIGNKAQYLQYLSTIFKTSKVKNIVYRGSEKTDDKLFQYFTKNFAEAYVYSKAHVTKGGLIIERNPIPVIQDNIAKKYNLDKEIMTTLTDTQLGIDGLEFEGFISKDIADRARDLLSNNDDIKNFVRLTKLYPLIKTESEEELMKQFEDGNFQNAKKEYDELRNKLKLFFEEKQVGKLTISVLNITNPYTDEIVQEDLRNNRDAYKSGHDGAFLADGEHFLVKKDTNQIHILGSDQDTQGFREFVDKSKSYLQPKEKTTKCSIM